MTEGATAVRKRGRETVADMARSMAVVGGVVALLFLVVVWQRPEGGGPSVIRPVDVAGVVSAVRIGNALPVWAPDGLPSTWRPTAAWYATGAESDPGLDGSVLLLGYLTPSGSYAEVRQTDGDRAVAIRDWTDSGRRVGTVPAGGRTWTHLESPGSGQQALVLTRHDSGKPVLVVVTGKADVGELTTLAGSLR